MTVLFGHPTGTPFSHHAALAHYEAGWLESFCVPWMPSPAVIKFLAALPPLRGQARRLSRRYFAPLARAPKTQGRLAEISRLIRRAAGANGDEIADEANDWLMAAMAREMGRPKISAVHAYEDCALVPFQRARQRGVPCLYEMPIGYFPAWQRIRAGLESRYADWLPSDREVERAPDRVARKLEEMALADHVLAPSRFVRDTVLQFHPGKSVAITPYGADVSQWAAPDRAPRQVLNFLFVGHCSLRKGTPLLLEGWRAAKLKDARLQLVGAWRLAEDKKHDLPDNCDWSGPVSSDVLRGFYHDADVFVFPTNFEGRALVTIEALASGLPLLTTTSSGADDAVLEPDHLLPPDDLEALVEGLRWFDRNRSRLPQMRAPARASAERSSWDAYREQVRKGVAGYV